MTSVAGPAAARAAVAQAIREIAARAHPDLLRAAAAAAAAAGAGAAGQDAGGTAAAGRYDRAIDMLNRLPRPVLTLGTVALFCYAVAAPAAFAERMAALADVPEPLWWLLGAVISLHFGAREAHHFRARPPAPPPPQPRAGADAPGPGAAAVAGEPARGPR